MISKPISYHSINHPAPAIASRNLWSLTPNHMKFTCTLHIWSCYLNYRTNLGLLHPSSVSEWRRICCLRMAAWRAQPNGKTCYIATIVRQCRTVWKTPVIQNSNYWGLGRSMGFSGDLVKECIYDRPLLLRTCCMWRGTRISVYLGSLGLGLRLSRVKDVHFIFWTLMVLLFINILLTLPWMCPSASDHALLDP